MLNYSFKVSLISKLLQHYEIHYFLHVLALKPACTFLSQDEDNCHIHGCLS